MGSSCLNKFSVIPVTSRRALWLKNKLLLVDFDFIMAQIGFLKWIDIV